MRGSSFENRFLWNNNHSINEPYYIPTNISDNPEEVVNVKAIDRFKIDQEELHQDPYFTTYLSQYQVPMNGVTYWFHATDHTSALNIIGNGIDLDKSRAALDFSDGSGFYLTRYV